MTEINRSTLFGKLNSLAYKAIEGATVFCKLRGNPYVELVHWIQQILQTPGLRPAPHRQALRAGFVAAGEGHHRGPGPAAARRHVDLGFFFARGERRRARLGLRHADVRRVERAHRPPRRRHPEDAVVAQCVHRDVAAVRRDQARHADGGVLENRPRLSRGPARRQGRVVVRRTGRSQRRHGARADGEAGGAQAIRDGSDRAGAQRGNRSGDRPRRGDPADRRYPDAPPAEQPDPDGRSGRRKNRGRRGLRAAPGARRRAARRCRTSPCTRSTSACCRLAPA